MAGHYVIFMYCYRERFLFIQMKKLFYIICAFELSVTVTLSRLYFCLFFYCMNVSMLLIQPPGCHNPINVMLCYVVEYWYMYFAIQLLLLLQPFYSNFFQAYLVSRYQKKHSPNHRSWSSSNLYQLIPSTTIHSILPVQFIL